MKKFKAKAIFWEFVEVIFFDPLLAAIGGVLFSIAMVIFAIYKFKFTDADRYLLKKMLEDNGVTNETKEESLDPDGPLHFFPLCRNVLTLYWKFINRFMGIDF